MDYKTILNEGNSLVVEKKSKFIGRAYNVTSEKEAVEKIQQISKLEYNARHNCFAYVLKDSNIQRCSDDGEPSGTAGKPILEIIMKEELKDVLVVITRYFGGTLLGTGGLVRNYGASAKEALINGTIIEKALCNKYELVSDYNFSGKAEYYFKTNNIEILDIEYSDNVKYTVLIKQDLSEKAQKDIFDLTNGQLNLSFVDTEYINIEI